jgi:hypothetical protein
VEIEPGHTAESQRQILEQPLGDEAQLNVPLVSGELAAEVLTVARTRRVRPSCFGIRLDL